ncbi:arginine vasopressin-induced protein 1 [Poecilia reticulata]|uniref:arginine vasopressin-induced protein 1 n=1 Tax=Poecilia reticulata TaxID=8081 RepID=UPI0004A4A1D3|nr:PREDICTED: arginine vasopressin-induced protein 1 [Poecilia reticulata]
MDTRSASASPSVVAGPSSLWRLAERRRRKSGSGNIFSTVNLWQLQRLFRAAGDEDAEQRAQLVWGHRDEAELAQALIALRSRGHRRALRTNGRDAMGSHWLRAFSHLRIGETSPRRQGKDAGEDRNFRAETKRSPESYTHSSFEATSAETGAESVLTEIQNPNGNFDRATASSSGLRRTGESNPERYLHRILH